jgi:hypothetical protein
MTGDIPDANSDESAMAGERATDSESATASDSVTGDGSPVSDGGHEDGGVAQTGKPAEVTVPDGIDWRGWLLVGVVVVSVLVVPALVLSLSETHWLLTWLGFSRRQAYLVFPMVPAILLGVTVVWVTIRTYES